MIWVAIAMAVLLGGCSGVADDETADTPSESTTKGITGRYVGVSTWPDCADDEEYFQAGAELRVVNEEGDLLGTGTLGSAAPTPNVDAAGEIDSCSWPFQIDGLPESDVYRLSVGGRFEETWMPLDDLEGGSWKVRIKRELYEIDGKVLESPLFGFA